MPPKLKSDDGRNVVIRPLCLVFEDEIKELLSQWQFPVIPCNLCGSQDGMKRQQVKALLTKLSKDIPDIKFSMLGALGNIHQSQMMDQSLWDFKNL
jgi:tRNA 2-thiocytidine biosynthesis protein TtcA